MLSTMSPALDQSAVSYHTDQVAALVREAAERIQPQVIHTPLIRLPWLDRPGREVWAKLDCWQRTGSFKYRGALNAVTLAGNQRPVTTASAGNHGLAVATVAHALEIPAVVFVPTGASELKVRR